MSHRWSSSHIRSSGLLKLCGMAVKIEPSSPDVITGESKAEMMICRLHVRNEIEYFTTV